MHKMQISLKELRETSIWLRFAYRLCGRKPDVSQLSAECDELISIFVQSINTLRER